MQASTLFINKVKKKRDFISVALAFRVIEEESLRSKALERIIKSVISRFEPEEEEVLELVAK